MSSSYAPKILTFKSDGVIAKGKVVKPGSDREHVVVSALATSKNFGICQNDVAAAEDLAEVAMPGGGAKGLAGGAIAFGDLLTSDVNGKLVATTNANDRAVAIAMEDAVDGDLFSVYVQVSNV